MDGIDKIIKKIEEEAKYEADRISSEAAAKAAEIICDYEERASEALRTALEHARSAAEETQRRSCSASELRARNIMLSKKRQIIDKAFNAAYDKLCALSGDEYVKVLTALIFKGAPNGGELIFSQKDRCEYGQIVTDEVNRLTRDGNPLFSLSDRTRNIPGGVIISNGDIETNCSFDMLIDHARGKIQMEIAKILFD